MEKKNNHVIEKAGNFSYVSLRNINKVYDNKVQAVFDFNLEVSKQEFIVLVGPSGCGKSTTLRMIAGLEDITSGDLYIDGVFSNNRAPKDRDIAMVFQSYALYPHMSVYDNMAFGLKIRRYHRDEIDKRVREAARILEIEELLDRKPKALSGGQRQRVALGRAIVRNAKVFLMDEPLSNLDAKLRVQMRSEIIKLHEELSATTIYVTHDQTEAMTMATRIVVMKGGYIQQIGTPFEIYNSPANLFVAGFVGSPPMNFVNANYDKGIISFANGFKIKIDDERRKKHDDFYKAAIDEVNIQLDKLLERPQMTPVEREEALKKREVLLNQKESYKEPHKVVFGIRPEDVFEATSENREKLKGEAYKLKVTVAELLGHEYYVHSDFAGSDLVAKIPSNRPIGPHEELEFIFDLKKIHLFDAETTARIF